MDYRLRLLVFSLSGLSFVVAIVTCSLIAFRSVNPAYLKSARSLGASEWRIFWRVVLPLAWLPILIVSAIAFTVDLVLFISMSRI